MDSEILKKTQSLTTAEKMRNQTKLVMQPYANWEEYLTPAPLSIAILGELVFISSSKDFSINKNPPEGGFQYIRYPESFRACLMQVCNSGWGAFNEAHTNMDQIRLHTLAVPDYMKAAVKILFQDDDEFVQTFLPDQLENIRVIADDCLELANETKKRFTYTINIIQELLEACVNAQGCYLNELDDIKKKLKDYQKKKEDSEKAINESAKTMKVMEKELEKAQESYQKAMDSIPSGWEIMAMDVVASLTDSITALVNGLTSRATHPVSQFCNASTMPDSVMHDIKSQEAAIDPVDLIQIFSKSAAILMCTENVQRFVQDNMINWQVLYDQKNKVSVTDFLKNQFQGVKTCLEESPNCNLKTLAQTICDEGIVICVELAKYAPEGKCEDDKTKELIEKIKKLTESARIFDSISKDTTKDYALHAKPPMRNREESKSEKMSASQIASQNSRFRVEQSRAQLDKTRETYEKSVEKMEENQKELTEVLNTMGNCVVKEINFETTIEMLVKGMGAMGRVKEQWEKMVHFFQMVSNIVKTSLTRTLKDFGSTCDKSQSLPYNKKLFTKDLLYNQAFQATNIASLVHMISATYTDVSTKHIMDRVSSLGKLMAMDKEKPEFESERQMLHKSCKEAQKAILRLVLKNKQEFERKSLARLGEIDKELLTILPAAAPEEIKSIQEAVKRGFNEEEIANYC